MSFEQSPDFRVFNDIIQMRQGFLGIHNWNHPRYPLYSYPQRLCLLSDMNRVYILREIGSIPKFLELETEIMAMPGRLPSTQDTCIYDMTKWTDEQIKIMKPFIAEKEKVVISLLCYGKEYTHKALNWMFKSLMTEDNLPILCKEKQVIFHIQTDEASKSILENAPIIAKIKALNVHFEYCIMPDSLVAQIDVTSVYWLVGAGATLAIEYARICNAAFHHCYPDIVYSENFFAEILRLSKFHSSILAPGHRSDEAVLLPSLKPYEKDDIISVPAPDLIALELNAAHMAQWPGIVNNRPGPWCYPQSHNIIWETPNTIFLNCPHLNAWWLSKEVIAKSPQRFYISLDSELDFLCEGDDFYIPQVADSLYLVEFSNQGKQKVEDMWLDAQNYAAYFWKLSTNRDNLKFFTRAMQLRINRNIRPVSPNIMEEQSMMNEMVYLFNTIQSKDPGVGTTLTRPRTHLNRIYGITKTELPKV
jgi:hypothetical protein